MLTSVFITLFFSSLRFFHKYLKLSRRIVCLLQIFDSIHFSISSRTISVLHFQAVVENTRFYYYYYFFFAKPLRLFVCKIVIILFSSFIDIFFFSPFFIIFFFLPFFLNPVPKRVFNMSLIEGRAYKKERMIYYLFHPFLFFLFFFKRFIGLE